MYTALTWLHLTPVIGPRFHNFPSLLSPQVPLKDESVDVAVFCLSLMGTNLSDFLKEANRVLKPGGMLKVAEVASRFVDMRGFLGALAQLGFKLVSKDLTNSYFYLLNFHKIGPPKAQGPLRGLTLRPCLYKRR
uniref:Ribosomal RNA-processing protein 8 n=1 Tax=Vombatus ursinus TaxID=29139 RepID=A0A4X2K289_VOMUR